MENPKQEPHGEVIASNDNKQQIQNNTKELLRRIEYNTTKTSLSA